MIVGVDFKGTAFFLDPVKLEIFEVTVLSHAHGKVTFVHAGAEQTRRHMHDGVYVTELDALLGFRAQLNRVSSKQKSETEAFQNEAKVVATRLALLNERIESNRKGMQRVGLLRDKIQSRITRLGGGPDPKSRYPQAKS